MAKPAPAHSAQRPAPKSQGTPPAPAGKTGTSRRKPTRTEPRPPLSRSLSFLFVIELLFQCKVLLGAANDLNASRREAATLVALKKTAPVQQKADFIPRMNQVDEETWAAIQQLLGAGATISRILWGQDAEREASRQALRSIIPVSESSPLRDRALRNDWEHLDERAEDWESASASHNMSHRGIGGRVTGLALADQFLHFDPTTMTVTFWSHSVSIPVLVDEAQALRPRLEAALLKL